ncbi:MAG: hypothetical protein WDO13_10580 [Verrucomicrobiota bacterium]
MKDKRGAYCSSLCYLAFQLATGEQMGKLEKLRDLDWKPYERFVREDQDGSLPLDRVMITPGVLVPRAAVARSLPQQLLAAVTTKSVSEYRLSTVAVALRATTAVERAFSIHPSHRVRRLPEKQTRSPRIVDRVGDGPLLAGLERHTELDLLRVGLG